MKLYLSIVIIASLTLISCSKKNSENSETSNTSSIQKTYLSNLLEHHDSHTSIIGKGYNSVDKTIKNNCLDNTYHEFIQSGKSEVNFFNNLSSEELSEKLNINVNGKLHSPQGEVSIDSNFLNMLNTNEASSTVTLIANVTNGKNRLKRINEHSPGYKLNDFYKSIFDKSKAEFIKVCGDEIIDSQKLSAYLVITARIDFKNKATKDKFEAKVGGGKNIFEEIGVNASSSISNLDENTRKSIKITVAGLQLGGEFKQLQSILKKNVCNLNQVEQCSQMFDTINNYFSNEFMNQLDTKNENSWIVSEIKSTPYSKLIILDDKLEYFSDQFNYGLNYAKFSAKLSNIKEINSEAFKNIKKILSHEYYKHFSNDEKNYLSESLNSAQNNINMVDEYFSECNSSESFKDCIRKYQQYLDQNYVPIDQELRNAKVNNYIASYNTGIHTFEINNNVFYKKEIDKNIFPESGNLSYIFLNEYDDEINDNAIELVCQLDYRSKLNKVNSIVWFSSFISSLPTLYTLLEKAVKQEFVVLDVIWNRKDSDVTTHYIKDNCGNHGKLFFISHSLSNTKKISIWQVKE
ncbi:hypothetical protein [Pigmentibacter ruber]|uniref:hypothetical protein n=1 Tax=Pigmentibacter ruber TaxID=2683196 RepID=UPI00131A6D67|nr:hypothetical protein [Pigmentibacter ruber]BFD31034.1 hypothetical protein GTC16762_06520 [Pigmentibacter ruber]